MENSSRRLTTEELNLLKEKSLYLDPTSQPEVYEQLVNKLSSPSSMGDGSKAGMNQPASVDTGLAFEAAGRASKFDRRTPLDTVLEGGIEDFRGEQQSVGDKLANGILVRFPLTTATKLLEGIGYMATAPAWLVSGDISMMTENPFSKVFAELEERVKEVAPIYKPAHLRDGSLLDHIGSASFWMDEGVDAAAFFAGFAAFGYGFAALNAGSKVANLIGSTSKAFIKGVDLTLATTAQTVSEAGFEAAHFGKEFNNQIERELGNLSAKLEVQGLAPEQIEFELANYEQELLANKAEAQAKIFRTNVGILLGPNLLMNKFLFGKFFNGEGALASRITGTTDDVLNAATQYSRREIATKFAKQAGLGVLSEGFWEEGMQETATRYFESIALGQTDDKFVEGMVNTYFDSLGDVNQQKSIFLGAVLGMFGGGYGAVSSSIGANKELAKIHKTLSEHPIHILDRTIINDIVKEGEVTAESFKVLYDYLDNVSKVVKKDSFKDLLDLAGKKDLSGLIEHLGTLDAFYSLLTMEGGITAAEKKLDSITEAAFEEYTKKQGIEPKAKFESYKQEMKTKLREFQEVVDAVDNKFGFTLSELSNTLGIDSKSFNDIKNSVAQHILYALTATTVSREYMRNLRQVKAAERLKLLSKYNMLSTEEFLASDEVSSLDKESLKNVEEAITSSTEAMKKFDEDFNSLTNKETLQQYLDKTVEAAEELKKKLEQAAEQGITKEDGTPSNITDPVLNNIRSQTIIDEAVTDSKGVKRTVPYRGTVELTFERTNADGSITTSSPMEYKVIGLTKDGNIQLEQVSDSSKKITIAPNGGIINAKVSRWTNWKVIKSAREVRLESQREQFRQAMLEYFPDRVVEHEQALEEFKLANEQLASVERSLSNAVKRVKDTARIDINETNIDLIRLLTNKKLKDTQKAVFLTIKQLEALRSHFVDIRDNAQASVESYNNFLEKEIQNFDPEIYNDYVEIIEDEIDSLNRIVSKSDEHIGYLTNKINNMKRWIKNLHAFINNRLRKAGLLDSEGHYTVPFEEGMSVLDGIDTSEIQGAEQNLKKAQEKINTLEKELEQALEEVPVEAKRRLRELKELATSKREIYALYEQIRRQSLLSTFEQTPAKPDASKGTLSRAGQEANAKKDADSATEPSLHPFSGYVSDLFTTVTNQEFFENNPVLFEPQLLFQRFIDDYDVSSRSKNLKLMNAELLLERHGDILTEEQRANISSPEGLKGVYAVIYNTNNSVYTEASLHREGENSILFSVLPEGTKQDNKWVNSRNSGFEVVSEKSFYKAKGLDPSKTESKEAFDRAFDKAFEEYNTLRERIREAKSPVTVPITSKTAGTIRDKSLPENNAVGTLVEKQEQLPQVDVIMGDGTTKQNIGGSERVLEDGVVKIVYKGRIINTYRQDLTPDDVNRVIELIQGTILHSENQALRDEYMSALDDLTYLSFEDKVKNKRDDFTLYFELDSKKKVTKIQYGKKNSIDVKVFLNPKENQAAIDSFKEFLGKKFYNVKKTHLENKHKPYEVLVAENVYNADGTIASSELAVAETWNSYSEYLMVAAENRVPRFKVKLPVINNKVDEMTNSPFINRAFMFDLPTVAKTTEAEVEQEAADKSNSKFGLSKDKIEAAKKNSLLKSKMTALAEQIRAEEEAEGGETSTETKKPEEDKPLTPSKESVEDIFSTPLPTEAETTDPGLLEALSRLTSEDSTYDAEAEAEAERIARQIEELENTTPDDSVDPTDDMFGEDTDVEVPLSSPVGIQKRQRVEKQLAEFRKRFPDVVVEVDPDLSVEAMMQLKDGKLKVLTRPETVEGGLFHEGFHIVNLLVNTKEQRDSVYKEVRRRLGNAIVTVENQEIVGKELTDAQAEEFLAEEFRNYMLIGKKGYKFGEASSAQKSIFTKIMEAIEKLLKFFGMDTRLTESLFDRIDKGVFTSNDIVAVDKVTAYRIGDLTSEDSTAIVNFVNFKFFDILHNHPDFKDINFTDISDPKVRSRIYNEITKEVTKRLRSGEFPPILKHYTIGNLKDIYKSHFKNLKQYAIDVKFDRDSLEDIESSENKIDIPKQFIDSTQINVKETAGIEIKLLIAGLPHKVRTKDGTAFLTKRGLESTVPFAQTIGVLHKHLAGINHYEEMVYKLAELSEQYPHFQDLLVRLGSTPENAYAIMDERHSNLRSKFFNQFHKSENPHLIGIVYEGGMYYLDGTAEATEKFMVEQWKANAATKNVPTPTLFTSQQGKLKINLNVPITVNGVKIKISDVLGNFSRFKSLSNAVGIVGQQRAYRDFLNSLGFALPETFGEVAEDMNLMSKTINFILTNADSLIKERTKKYKQTDLYLEDIYSREAIRINKEIKELAVKLSQYSEHFIGNQTFNNKGQAIYNLNDKTAINKLVDELNQDVPVYLIPFGEKYGSNFGTIGSRWIKYVQQGDKLKVTILKQFGEERTDKIDINELVPTDFVVFEFNAVLNGKLPFLRSADRGTEMAFDFGRDYITYKPSELKRKRTQVFKDYLRGEIISAFAHQNEEAFRYFTKNEFYKELSFFAEIVPGINKVVKGENPLSREAYAQRADAIINNPENKKYIESQFEKYFTEQRAKTLETLVDLGVVVKLETNGVVTYDVTALDTQAINAAYPTAKFDFTSLDAGTMETLVDVFNFEYISGTIEQTKLITGDVNTFKKVGKNGSVSSELHKRTNLHTATLSGTMNDPGFVAELNVLAPRIDGTSHTNHAKVFIRQDTKVDSKELETVKNTLKNAKEVSAYEDMTEDDAGGKFTLDAAESYLRRNGKLTDGKAKTLQYQKQFLYRHLINTKRALKLFNEDSFKRVFSRHLPENYDVNKMYYLGKEVKFSELEPIEIFKPQGTGAIVNTEIATANKKFSLKLSASVMMPTDIVGTQMFEDLIEATIVGADLIGPRSMNKHEALGNKEGKLLSLYDSEGKFNKLTEAVSIKNKAPQLIMEIDWNSFADQVEIDASGKENVTFSTQMRRLAVIDILTRGTILDGRINLSDDVTERNHLHKVQVERDLKKLLSSLGLSESTANEYKLTDNARFIDTIIRQLDTRLQPDNVVDSVVYVMEQAEKYFQTLPTQRQVVNLIQGLIRNKVIKTKTKGDMLVQEPSTGYERGPRTVRNGKVISGVLNFYRLVDKNGNQTTDLSKAVSVLPAEAIVALPKTWMEPIRKILGHTEFTQETLNEFNYWMLQDGTKKDSKGNRITKWEYYDAFRQIRTVLANRVPTQHLNSMEALEIVEFKSPAFGPRIVLPSEIVAKSGSDFDIDKLTTYLNNVSFNNETGVPVYDVMSETVEKSSDNAIQNRIAELTRNIILDVNNFSALIKPNNSNIVDEQAAELSSTKESSNISEMLTFVYNAQIAKTQWGAAKLIGIGAVNNTFHSLMQSFPVGLNSNIVELFFDGFKDSSGEFGFGYLNNQESDVISSTIGNTMTAILDANKHSIAPIDLVNLTTSTSNSYYMLMMLGRGDTNPAGFRNLSRFFTQEIVLDIEKALRKNESKLRKALKRTQEKKAIVVEVLKKHGITVPKGHTFLYEYMSDVLKSGTEERANITKRELRKQLDGFKSLEDGKAYLSEKSMKDNPLLVAEFFLYYQELGKAMRLLQSVTRPDASLPKDRTAVRVRQELLERLKLIGIFNNDNLDKLFDKSFVGAYKNAHDVTYQAFNEFDAIQDIESFKNFVWGDNGVARTYLNPELSKPESDIVDAVHKISNAVVTYMLHTTRKKGRTIANIENAPAAEALYNRFMVGENSMANRLERLKARLPKDNAFLSEAVGVVREFVQRRGEPRKTDYIKFYNRKLSVAEFNAISESIEDMANHADPEVKKFAKDLVLLSIIQSGVQVSPVSFFDKIPHEMYHAVVQDLFTLFKLSNRVLGLQAKRAVFNNLRNDSSVVPRVYVKFPKDVISINKNSQNTNYDYVAVEINEGTKEAPKYIIYAYEKTGELDSKGNPVYRKLPQRGDGYAMFDARPSVEIALPKISRRSGEVAQDIKYEIIPDVEATSEPTNTVAQDPTMPEFNKLPNYTPGQKTMSYAGVGSRKTPANILSQMKEVAKELAKRGYTLRSGAAIGADKAFESGATKKQIFKASDATNLTRTIAREVHPNPQALGGIGLDLMARNTNQIFGKDLNSPVDFVLAWTPDGITDYSQRTIKSGGTGQAIDMASRKGIPVINLANPNWKQRLDSILGSEELQLDTGRRIQPSEIKADKKLTDALTSVWKRLGLQVQAVEDIYYDGKLVDAVAKANAVLGTIEYVENKRNIETLPEETAHIFVSLLPESHPLKKVMLSEITKTPYYLETVEKYGEIYEGNEAKLKLEAVGKAITDAMVRENALRLDKESWSKVETWWRGLKRWIKELFTKQDPYTKAAIKLLDNNLSDLISKSELVAQEQQEMLQVDDRLTVLSDYEESMRRQRRIEEENKRLREAEKFKLEKLYKMEDSDIAEADRVQLEQSEQDMARSEERIVESNKIELQKPLQVKEGVSSIFESTPELANIGTQQQYSQYLDTIFPDSKVKDIVYHGTDAVHSEFKKEFIGTVKPSYFGKGFYLSTSKEYAQGFGKNLMFGIVNINNLLAWGNDPEILVELSDDKTIDGVKIINSDVNGVEDGTDEIIVFEPEQIHILGSKQDIEGFKKFVKEFSTESISETTIQEQLDNFEKFYPLFSDVLTTQEARREFIKDIMSGKLQIVC